MNVSHLALERAIDQLADAAKLAREKNPEAVSCICSAVAFIIFSAGWTTSDQQRLMDYATMVGFEPYYYVNSIRVEWPAPKAPRTKRATNKELA